MSSRAIEHKTRVWSCYGNGGKIERMYHRVNLCTVNVTYKEVNFILESVDYSNLVDTSRRTSLKMIFVFFDDRAIYLRGVACVDMWMCMRRGPHIFPSFLKTILNSAVFAQLCLNFLILEYTFSLNTLFLEYTFP